MLLWESVLELEDCYFNVAVHGSFESVMGIVPVKVNVDISVAFPVRLHEVVVLEGVFQVEGVGFVDIFDPEVVNNESERDGYGLVEAETRGVLAGPNFVLQLVIIDDFLGDVLSMHAYVFKSI